MNLQLAANLLEYLKLLFMRRFARAAVPVEETSHSGMIFLQNGQYIHSETPEYVSAHHLPKWNWSAIPEVRHLLAFYRRNPCQLPFSGGFPLGLNQLPTARIFASGRRAAAELKSYWTVFERSNSNAS